MSKPPFEAVSVESFGERPKFWTGALFPCSHCAQKHRLTHFHFTGENPPVDEDKIVIPFED